MKLVTYFNDEETKIDTHREGERVLVRAQSQSDKEPKTLLEVRVEKNQYGKFEIVIPHDSDVVRVTRTTAVVEEEV